MYSKKYRLTKLEEFGRHNPIYDEADGSVCYLAYLNPGERGWFLFEKFTDEYWYIPHRVHTSVIQDVDYSQDGMVVLTTENTKFTFERI